MNSSLTAAQRLRRYVADAVILAGIVVVTAGAACAEEVKQVWPEWQLRLSVDSQTRIILMGKVTREEDTPTNLQVGVGIDHRFDEHFSMRLGYLEGFALQSGASGDEQRPYLEQTFGCLLPLSLQVELHSRGELRWLDGAFSWRVRERLQIQRRFEIATYRFTPYASAEAYYDSRYDAFSRTRLSFGAIFPVDEHLSVDVYGSRQMDNRPTSKTVDALGLRIIFAY